jgi:hypothetical protein
MVVPSLKYGVIMKVISFVATAINPISVDLALSSKVVIA